MSKLQDMLNKVMGVRFEETTRDDIIKCGFVESRGYSDSLGCIQYERREVRILYDPDLDKIVSWSVIDAEG